jgi:hypothetical protein
MMDTIMTSILKELAEVQQLLIRKIYRGSAPTRMTN